MTPLDWAVIAAYAVLLVVLGWWTARGTDSAASHLRADRSLPAWAVVFSVLATEVSAATYVSVPAAGFTGQWSYLQYAFGSLLGKVVLATVFIQLYWRLNISSAYGFLRQRLGPASQRTAAWAFLGGRLIASGVRLYIAALALSAAANFPIPVAVVVIALVSTVYTWMGGLRAVVATDVAQGIVFMLGAATALAVGLAAIDAPLAELAHEVLAADKTQVFFMGAPDGQGWWQSTRPFPMALLAGFALVLATHGTDQENVQNLLNTKSARSSARSLVASALFTFPIVALFLAVGTMLWLYHRHVPVTAYDPVADAQQIFPLFIVHALPAGIRGLVFAGLFAAAVVGATLNAMTTIWIGDIRGRANLDVSRTEARALNAVFGVLLAAVGLFFWRWTAGSREDLIEVALNAMTILYGGLLGGFLCGLLYTRRGSDLSVACGMGTGALIGAAAFFQRELLGIAADEPKVLEWPLTMLLSILAALAVGALGRRAAPRDPGPGVA
jgi:solute:Na+ symporter, SSS family